MADLRVIHLLAAQSLRPAPGSLRLARRIGAAALTISAITPRPALALSPATPATKSISSAAATQPIQVQHHFGPGDGGPRLGGFHGGGPHVYGGPWVYGAPRPYGRPHHFGVRHYGFHRRYYRPQVYGYYDPTYYGSAYYYPADYDNTVTRVYRVVWTYFGPHRVGHVRDWRHHWLVH